MPLADGDHYAGFTINRLLGAGSTGTVYLATDPRSGRQVALKILRAGPSADERRHQRFLQTNEALSHLRIPGAARIVEFGELRGRLWVATEYVPGIDADALLHQHFPTGVPHRSLCLIADKVAHTLDAAHAARILHRDIKPSNVVVDDPFSASYRMVLTDFAQGLTGRDSKAYRYASPELLSGLRVGPRSDQFALAATVFHLLTGRPAFNGSDRVMRAGHVEFDEAALAAVQNAPSGLREVFTIAFDVDPTERFDSCDQFAAAFRAPQSHISHPVPFVPLDERPRATTAQQDPPRKQRTVWITAGIALVAAVAVTAAVVMTGKTRPKSTPATAAPSTAAASVAAPSKSPECQQLEDTLAALQPRQKLAQLLMVGVKNLDDAQSAVRDQEVGGIMIGSWTDLGMMGAPLKGLESETRPIPLAVSVDEEGGRVSRLKGLIGPQLSPRELVATGLTPDQVRELAKKRGLDMQQRGITVDFAPVVDTTDADADSVIGDRSFSDNPDQVILYAGAYADGLLAAGILPVLKHFPGHGHASGDSHKNGVQAPDLDKLKAHDLIPYVELTKKPVAVMIGHMVVPKLTDGEQASLSPAAYKLLRDGSYGQGAQPFTGPIFTDDLSSMKAISNDYDVPTAVLMALKAGADNALWITTKEVKSVLDRLEQAVQSGDLPQAQVDASVRRMATTKNTAWAACATS